MRIIYLIFMHTFDYQCKINWVRNFFIKKILLTFVLAMKFFHTYIVKLMLTFFMICIATVGWSQEKKSELADSCAQVMVEERCFDFGSIHADDGVVKHCFVIKNTGSRPLVFLTGATTCGCTTVNYPHEEVLPGSEASIEVSYNPHGRQGHFNQAAVVTTNAVEKRTRFYITGTVMND